MGFFYQVWINIFYGMTIGFWKDGCATYQSVQSKKLEV